LHAHGAAKYAALIFARVQDIGQIHEQQEWSIREIGGLAVVGALAKQQYR
jgi:hypothetical protein